MARSSLHLLACTVPRCCLVHVMAFFNMAPYNLYTQSSTVRDLFKFLETIKPSAVNIWDRMFLHQFLIIFLE